MRCRKGVLALGLLLLLAACGGPAQTGTGMGIAPGMMERHMAPVPAEYANLANPVSADADSIKGGQVV